MRRVLFAVALGAIAAGMVLLVSGTPAGMPMLIWGAVLLVALLIERWRYRPASSTGAGAWQETEERFIDPESGQAMQVLFNPHTGERRYVPAPPQAADGR